MLQTKRERFDNDFVNCVAFSSYHMFATGSMNAVIVELHPQYYKVATISLI